MKSGKFKKSLAKPLAAALALCTLCGGQAMAEEIVENVVVPLPTPAQAGIIGGADDVTGIVVADAAENPYALLADQSEYAEDIENNRDFFPMQYPALTEEEAARVTDLLARYDAGERAAQPSVLGATENVRIGVYALPAEQYGGEGVYLILPDEALTDDDLLAIIEAYDALGLRFDPGALTLRNCMRGASATGTRELADTEPARYAALTDHYRRRAIPEPQGFTALPGDDGVGVVTLEADLFCGLTRFLFFPARRMADDELLGFVAAEMGTLTATAEQLAACETALLRAMHDQMGMPYSVTRVSESFMRESDNAAYGTERMVYYAQFEQADDLQAWWGYLSAETGELVYASWFDDAFSGIASNVYGTPYDPQYAQIARQFVEDLGGDIADVQALGDGSINGMPGAQLRVTLLDGATYDLAVDYATSRVFSLSYSDAERSQNEADYMFAMYESWFEEGLE